MTDYDTLLALARSKQRDIYDSRLSKCNLSLNNVEGAELIARSIYIDGKTKKLYIAVPIDGLIFEEKSSNGS